MGAVRLEQHGPGWRKAMLEKLIACGATPKIAALLLDCGLPWTL